MPTLTDALTGKVPRVVAAMKYFHPIPLGADGLTPAFTDAAWVRECLRRYIIHKVAQAEQAIAQQAATVAEDDTLIT